MDKRDSLKHHSTSRTHHKGKSRGKDRQTPPDSCWMVCHCSEVAEASLPFTDRLSQLTIKLQSLLVLLHLAVSGVIMTDYQMVR